MLPSVRALLTEVVDFAGLFPPAQLEMSAAVDRFQRHSVGPERWMLARLVVPAARLEELSPLLPGGSCPRPPIRLAALGRPISSREGRAAGLSRDLADIQTFVERHPERAAVEQLELRLPDEADEIPGAVEGALEQIRSRSPALAPFFEASLLGDWPERLGRTIDALSAAAAGSSQVGLKIRCGGRDAAAVPSPQAVAAALAAGRRSGLPLKATQGLHQPVRHFDSGLRAVIHGFLNLFFAGVLAHVHALSNQELLAIVEDEEAAAFSFTDDGLAWRDLAAGLDDIITARRVAVTAFSSCSFSEPRDGLRGLGLLEGGASSDG